MYFSRFTDLLRHFVQEIFWFNCIKVGSFLQLFTTNINMMEIIEPLNMFQSTPFNPSYP